MKRSLVSKKFLRNAAIVLVIAVVAYVVMYGVKEGFQADNTVTKYINVSDTTINDGVAKSGNIYKLTGAPPGKKLVAFDMAYLAAAKMGQVRTSCEVAAGDVDKYISYPSGFGKSSSSVYIEAINNKGTTTNIYSMAYTKPPSVKKYADNVRRLGATDIPEGQPGGPPSVNDILGGITVKNLKTNNLNLNGKFTKANCYVTDNRNSDAKLTFTFA
jgi:hypothetical protein